MGFHSVDKTDRRVVWCVQRTLAIASTPEVAEAICTGDIHVSADVDGSWILHVSVDIGDRSEGWRGPADGPPSAMQRIYSNRGTIR